MVATYCASTRSLLMNGPIEIRRFDFGFQSSVTPPWFAYPPASSRLK